MENATHWHQAAGAVLWLIALLIMPVAVCAAADLVIAMSGKREAQKMGLHTRAAELHEQGFPAFVTLVWTGAGSIAAFGAGLAFWEFGG